MKKTKVRLAVLLAVLGLSFSLWLIKSPMNNRARAAISKVKPRLEEALAKEGLDWGSPIFIRIFKEEKELEVWVNGGQKFVLFKTYPICSYGSGTLGPKTAEWDGQAPEGFYYVTPDRMNPASQFHLSFNLGYPNAYDRIHNRTGSALMVHGDCVSIGCYAMTDKRIEEIYALADGALENGQPFFRVHIFPFRMERKEMRAHSDCRWFSFWQNLKKGYDFFEKKQIPPNVEVKNRKYVFGMPH